MNPFVNLNKRGVQLPKACTDLVDVLRAKKCEYCDDIAVATVGWPADYRWSEACQRDLAEFTAKEDYEVVFALKCESAISRYRADLQQRQEEFMHQRANERKAHGAA